MPQRLGLANKEKFLTFQWLSDPRSQAYDFLTCNVTKFEREYVGTYEMNVWKYFQLCDVKRNVVFIFQLWNAANG